MRNAIQLHSGLNFNESRCGMKKWDEVNDFGHYGIFDEPYYFYDDVKEMIENDLRSGKDFDTGWHGFKKEIEAIRIHAVGDVICIGVYGGMDEMPELIYDCDGAEKLTEEQEEKIQHIWDLELWTKTEDVRKIEVSRNSTINEIVKAATKALREIDSELKECFEFLEGTVKEMLESV